MQGNKAEKKVQKVLVPYLFIGNWGLTPRRIKAWMERAPDYDDWSTETDNGLKV